MAYDVTTLTGFRDARPVAAGPNGIVAAVGNVTQNADDANFYLSGVAGLPCSMPAPWGIPVNSDTIQSLVFAPDGAVIWVVSAASATAISTTTCLPVGAAITLPTPLATSTSGSAISPNGSTLFIANQIGDSIVVASTQTRAVTRVVTLPTPLYDQPQGIAVSPSGTSVYFTAYVGQTVGRLSAADGFASVTSVALGTPFGHPSQVAFSPDGRRAYIAEDRGVTVIDATTDTPIETIAVPAGPASSLALSSDGSRLYAPARNASPIVVAAIDTSTRLVVASIPLTGASWGTAIAVAASGTRAWVTDSVTDKVFEVRLGPGAPTGVTATATTSSLTVSFTAGTDNGAAITGYEYSLGGGAWTNTGTAETRFAITGLTAATAYSIRIRALNGQAPGDPSEAIVGTTQAAPAATSAAATSGTARVARPKARVTATRAVISTTVATTGAGVIAQSATLRTRAGRVLCRTNRRVQAAGTYTLSCALGRRDRAALRRHALAAVVTTTYTPTVGTAKTSTSTVTIPRRR